MPAPSIYCGFIVALGIIITGAMGLNFEACPAGWITYLEENSCLYISDSATKSLEKAHEKCVERNASLIMIQTEQKLKFFDQLIETHLSSSTEIWISLRRFRGAVQWLTKDGNVLARNLPSGFDYSDWQYNANSDSLGLIYRYGSLTSYFRRRYDRPNPRYICEKRRMCKKGYYGAACDKQCHCHGQECGGGSEIKCDYGCQIGWTGESEGCSKRKEDPDVRYFCVNSQDQGKYAHIRIDTKGIHYENIHAVNDNGDTVSWCNNTTIQTNKNLSIVTINIFTDKKTDEAVEEETCAGKIGDQGKYEWTIKIQENEGIVSRYDQEVHFECDFSEGDTLQLKGDTEINREKWFKQSNIKKPVENLVEKKEKVKMEVVDSATGEKMSETNIGSPVVLKIHFGLNKENVATGVQPYNCHASSADGEQKSRFLDENSCPMEGFPISAFHRNGTTKSLITKPFSLFGFDGSEEIDFHCSYLLCFEDPCNPGCREITEVPEHNMTTVRVKRSSRIKSQKMTGTIRVINDRK